MYIRAETNGLHKIRAEIVQQVIKQFCADYTDLLRLMRVCKVLVSGSGSMCISADHAAGLAQAGG